MSQLNLPHETDNEKVTEKLKRKKRICSQITVKVWGIHVVSPEEVERERLQWEGLAEKKGFKPGMK